MASSYSSPNNNNSPSPSPNPSFINGFDPTSAPNTTFVQADPSTFRAVVQRLTGAGKPISAEMGPRRRPAFKLHERRPTARKLEIKPRIHLLGENNNYNNNMIMMVSPVSPLEYAPVSPLEYAPVSPLEYAPAAARGSPRSPMEEEEKAIAEKGFYLHPSPLSTPRGSDPPELLPLFPLRSPRDESSS